MKKVRIGIIGVGRMGRFHARAIMAKAVKEAVLTAVCDINQKKLERFEKTGIKTFADYKDLAASGLVDGVIVSTPHKTHAEISIYMLEHNIHVLCEKPEAASIMDANRLNKTAKEKDRIVFGIMLNQRSNRLYQKAKDIINSGRLGDIVRANYIITNWYRSQAYYNQGDWRATWWGEGGGTLINQCVHQLDIMQWILGMPQKVLAKTRTVNRNISTENDVTAEFIYDNFICSMQASAHELHGTLRFEICGTCGKLVIGKRSMKIWFFAKDERKLNQETKFGYGYTPARRSLYLNGFRAITDLLYGQQRRVVKAFVKAVKEKDKKYLLAEGSEGINSLMLVNAAYLSASKGEAVNIPVDELEYEKWLDNKIEEEKSTDYSEESKRKRRIDSGEDENADNIFEGR